MTYSDRTAAKQLELEAQYQELGQRVDELAQYAASLDNPSDIHAMLVWLLNEHQTVIEERDRLADFATQLREIMHRAEAAHHALLDSDISHPDVERLWDEAVAEGEKGALTGLMMKIAIGQAISPTDAAALVNALERPDTILPAYRERIAARLRAIAKKFDEPSVQLLPEQQTKSA